MADFKQTNPSGPSRSHRELLANLDKGGDSSSDKEGVSDEEVDLLDLPHDGGQVGNLLGVSIGRAQTHMKSARTPAVEKARALEESRGYFEQDVTTTSDGDDTPTNLQTVHPQPPESKPSPWTSRPELLVNERSSTTRNLLGNMQGETRKRSSSGPTAIIEGLKKMFTDFPSYPSLASSSKSDIKGEQVTSEHHQAQSDIKTRSQRSRSINQSLLHPSLEHGLDRATPSSEQRDLRPKSLRRSTSDQSLYLRRVATGSSNFDDTAIFSNVADMQNPRFKAITDSLADSSIRMPKFPSLNFYSSRGSATRTESELLNKNTALNSRSYNASTLKNGIDIYSSGSINSIPVSEKSHPLLSEGLSKITGDVIFMGGYRGSVLRSAEPPHQQLWVPVKVGLGFRKVDLEVGLTREDEEKMEEKIIPSGILSHIGPIDIARRLIKKVRKCPNAKANQLRVHDWGYDWRLSPHLLSQRLIEFLETLACNGPETRPEHRGALVIAHSLGGLITRHAVNQRPDLFSGVVYAGAPQNCCNILGPLRNGDDVLLTSRVLTAQVNFTLRTSYALLPEDGRCFLNKVTGERYDLDFFNIDTWEEYRLSPCINSALPAYVQPQPRKSIVGSITESISSLTPSLPSKRLSWFSSSNSADTQSNNDTIKGKATEAKDDIEPAAKSTAEGIQSPVQEVQDSLEPTMKSNQQNRPSIATAVTLPKDKAREYLIRTLSEVQQFKAELAHRPAHQVANRYPPHAIIFGKSVPTVYGAKVASRDAIKCSDAFDDLAFAAGDGVVLASAAQLPEGYRCVKGGRVQSDRGHIGLLGDLEGIGQCINAVVDGRRRGVGLGSYV